jgi:hypothetical protein
LGSAKELICRLKTVKPHAGVKEEIISIRGRQIEIRREKKELAGFFLATVIKDNGLRSFFLCSIYVKVNGKPQAGLTVASHI